MIAMKITKEWLQGKNACSEGIRWFLKQKETDSLKVLRKLIAEDKLSDTKWLTTEDKLSDANWLIVRVMTRPQRTSYAIYAAEQVLHIFESEYPLDDRPRKAIKAAKAVLENDCQETREAAAAAAYDAAVAVADAADAAAANAAYAATEAAVEAADDAYAAANAAYVAANAFAYANADAATDDDDYYDYDDDAAYAADDDDAYAAARKAKLLKILEHGIGLLEE